MTDHRDETRAPYDGVVELYASLFADRLEGQPFSRAMIGTFAELLADAGLDPFARLLHDPASDRGFLDAHLLARRLQSHARGSLPRRRVRSQRLTVPRMAAPVSASAMPMD